MNILNYKIIYILKWCILHLLIPTRIIQNLLVLLKTLKINCIYNYVSLSLVPETS